MADYIYCLKKSNKPRMDIRVCQAKCPDRENCPDLADFLRNAKLPYIPKEEVSSVRAAALTR